MTNRIETFSIKKRGGEGVSSWEYSSAEEHLPSVYEAPGSLPSSSINTNSITVKRDGGWGWKRTEMATSL